MPAVDILILSNGPGELSTWVRPVVKALRSRLPDHGQARISVVLSPCANASGREADIARSFPEVDRVQGVEHFFPFLLFGKTAEAWDWHPQGVVLFLGGDQFYPLVIGKRLGYRTVIYAEWDARWHRWINRFACMKAGIVDAAPAQFRYKCDTVGDLMADVGADAELSQIVRDRLGLSSNEDLIGLMPGSKKDKLTVGLPFCLGTAEAIQALRPNTRFVIPVAPQLSVQQLAEFADRTQNPSIQLFPGATTATLQGADDPIPRLRTPDGVEVMLWQQNPAYDLMSQFRLCLTTIGANTAELGSLGVPMMVLLPTQKLDAMKAWDGVLGLLANLPLVGSTIAKGINALALRHIFKKGRLFAWPNLWAKREIVPELVGRLHPEQVAKQAVDYLEHPEKLVAIQQDLRSVRGEAGASEKLADMVMQELSKIDSVKGSSLLGS
jgi:hypothetical protein